MDLDESSPHDNWHVLELGSQLSSFPPLLQVVVEPTDDANSLLFGEIRSLELLLLKRLDIRLVVIDLHHLLNGVVVGSCT